jgi:hypothetical protein
MQPDEHLFVSFLRSQHQQHQHHQHHYKHLPSSSASTPAPDMPSRVASRKRHLDAVGDSSDSLASSKRQRSIDDAAASSTSSVTSFSLSEAVATLHNKSVAWHDKLHVVETLVHTFRALGTSASDLLQLRNNHAFKFVLSFVSTSLVHSSKAPATSISRSDAEAIDRLWPLLLDIVILIDASLRQIVHESITNKRLASSASWFVVPPSLLLPITKLMHQACDTPSSNAERYGAFALQQHQHQHQCC